MKIEKHFLSPTLLAGSIVIEPMKILLFFVVIGLLGFYYEGSEQSPIYIIVMVLSFIYSLSIYLLNIKQIRFTFQFLILIFVLFCLLVSGLYGILTDNYSVYATKYYYLFWVFSSCSILWGVEIGRKFSNYITIIQKWMELVANVTAINAIIIVSVPLIINRGIEYGSVTYQTMSYNSAFSFGLVLYYLLFGKRLRNRFKIFMNPLYFWFSICLLVLLAIGVLASGGRGAFILLVSYIVSTFWFSIKLKEQSSRSRKNRFLVFLNIFIILIIFIEILLKENSVLRGGFARAIQYIDLSNGSIKLNLREGSSNRDIVYLIAWQNILARPIFGYGFFNFIDLAGYPHNILLEFLLQGGIIYFLCMMAILIYAIIHMLKLIKNNQDYILILFIWQYPLVMLFFSGTYLATPLFWYGLVIILFSRKSVNSGISDWRSTVEPTKIGLEKS